MKRNTLLRIWLGAIGIACLSLPYMWWPVPFGIIPILHISTFGTLMGAVIFQTRRKGWFDAERAQWRGFAGVIVFSCTFLFSALAYRGLFFK